MSNMDEHTMLFKEEARELLSELEETLLELEELPDDKELVGKAFRALHTIKGSGAMFGFDDISKFTHQLETTFDMVRNGEMTISKELIDLTLESKDYIREMLETPSDEINKEIGEDIIASLKMMMPFNENQQDSDLKEKKIQKEEKKIISTYRIRFQPELELFLQGTNPLCILDELREMGKCEIIAYTDTIPPLDKYNPELCYTSWDIILSTEKNENDIRDVFIFVEDQCELNIEIVDRDDEDVEDPNYKKIGQILVERGDINPNDLQNVLDKKKYIGEMLVDQGLLSEEKIKSALKEQKHVKEQRLKRHKVEQETNIKVPSSRLDKLVDLVGELVIAQASLTQIASQSNNANLVSIAEVLERLTADLRDSTLNIRMLPIGTTFGKFRRLVRDLSKELGREIKLTTDGAETELDKTVIEKLNDPLVHLIRNSIDHGIEPPQIREEIGKNRVGNVHLSAVHSGANVLISIEDDGKGIDTDSIFHKAVEKGLISPDAQLSKKELFSLILHPGFSTNKKVTNVSGRGVGMDVVKQCIDSLRGNIEINSTKGIGTTIVLKLPLTLAIIEGLLVQVGTGYFVIPLSAVEECIELTKNDIKKSHGRNILQVRGEIVPYVQMRKIFKDKSESPEIQQIVITRHDNNKIGFVVDQVIGEHQTVIKSLGSVYRNIKGISGATILGDGNVALIIDVPQVMEEAEIENSKMDKYSYV